MFKLMFFLLLSIVYIHGQAKGKIEWKEQVIYFVLLDRFHNGSLQNDFHVNSEDPNAFHGGDIQGLIKKLPYLKELGITTIWLSPIFDNRDTKLETANQPSCWAYHGYWVKDFFKIEEHFGDEQVLEEFKREIKKQNMKLILDMIINHVPFANFKLSF